MAPGASVGPREGTAAGPLAQVRGLSQVFGGFSSNAALESSGAPETHLVPGAERI